jgi:hypothetical protein
LKVYDNIFDSLSSDKVLEISAGEVDMKNIQFLGIKSLDLVVEALIYFVNCGDITL